MNKLSTQEILTQYAKGIRNFKQKIIIVDQSLKEKDLSKADFTGSKFRGNNFRKASLKEAKLQKANFTKAKLQGIDFTEAKLQGANFTEAKLQGANFTEAKLEGANFTKAKLQGANFTKAKLKESNFEGAEANLQPTWKFFGGISLFFLSFILGFLIPVILSSLLRYEYLETFVSSEDPQRLLFFSTILLYLGFIIANLGLGIRAALWIVILQTISVSLTVISEPLITGTAWILTLTAFVIIIVNIAMIVHSKIRIVLWSTLLILGITFIFSFYENLINKINLNVNDIAFAVFLSLMTTTSIILIIARAGIIGLPKVLATITGSAIPFIIYTILIYYFFPSPRTEIQLLFSLVLFLPFALGIYIGWCTIKGDQRYVLIRNLTINLGAWGNTSFRYADLTKARFNNARLQNADLRETTLHHTDWYGARGLEQARVGTSYLQSLQVRELLTKKSGEVKNKNFDRLDLSGIKLQPRAKLVDGSFIGTNLSKAHLKEVDLSNSLLVETILDGADLQRATLNGICIENWRITKETNIDKVKCDYFYRRRPTPENPNPLREPENEEEILTNERFKELSEELINTEEKLKLLFRTFENLHVINNKAILEYRLIQEARKATISPDIYRKMFEKYRRQKVEDEWQKSAWKSIFARLEIQIEKLNQLISDMDIFPILEKVSQLSFIIAAIVFVNEISRQNLESKYRAWEILSGSEDKGGTIVALKNWKKYGGSLKGIKAQKANLENINLSYADLTDANFTNAILKNINLSYANLTDANFTNANLEGANLYGASFKGTIFKGAKLKKAQLGSEQNLLNLNPRQRVREAFEKTDLRSSNFYGADLSNANLSNTNLSGAYLSTDLSDDPSKETKPIKTNLIKANLSSANLSSANLSGSNLSGANLSGADLSSADLSSTDLSYVYLRIANLSSTNLLNAKLYGADLYRANLSNANLSSANLSSADLYRANLSSANLSSANLSDANLSDANLSSADLSSADLSNTNVFNTNLSGANLINTRNLTNSQIKSAYSWKKAIYKGNYNKEQDKWIIDEEANRKYIEQLKLK